MLEEVCLTSISVVDMCVCIYMFGERERECVCVCVCVCLLGWDGVMYKCASCMCMCVRLREKKNFFFFWGGEYEKTIPGAWEDRQYRIMEEFMLQSLDGLAN